MSWIVKCEKISENVSIAIIDIPKMTKELSSMIDEVILSICHGKNSIGYELNEVKDKLYRDLTDDGEIKSDVKRGAVAEFFVHVYLNSCNHKQECFFLNLEEPKGIKKGFDGLYSVDDEEWIMESKSGLSSTQNISHPNKIREACNDLKVKFSSKENENDPWRNAFMHAGNEDIGTSENIKSRLRKCAKKFLSNEPINIKQYNIIPASTIYIVDDSFDKSKIDNLSEDLLNQIKNFDYKKILVVCVTHHSVKIFIDYLRNKIGV